MDEQNTPMPEETPQSNVEYTSSNDQVLEIDIRQYGSAYEPRNKR